jgi:hypothetical protein
VVGGGTISSADFWSEPHEIKRVDEINADHEIVAGFVIIEYL